MAQKIRIWRRIWHYMLALLILAALIAAGIKIHRKRMANISDIPVEPLAPWALHFERVNSDPVDSGFPALAMVSTLEEVTIMPRISGRILTMGPREGISVKTGDLLVLMDTSEIQDTINSLKAKYISAKAEVKRDRDELGRETALFKNSGSTESAVEAMHTTLVAAIQNVSSLEHEIKSLMVRKGYGKIKAPSDGIISKRFAEPGDMAAPGHPLYKITTSTGAKVSVELPQSILQKIHIGTPIELYYNAGKAVLPVTRIFPTVDARALGIVEADFGKMPFGLPSGARIACRVILKKVTDILQVPYGSLICSSDRNQCSLFKLVRMNNKNILRKIAVEVKLRGHDGIAVQVKVPVTLKAGNEVVVAHESVLLQLKDGDPVVIAQGELP